AVAAFGVPALARRFGLRCAACGMALAGLSQVAFPYADGLVAWFALRFATGMAGALSVIPLETLISEGAPAHSRSRFFACYGLALTLGGALGMWTGLTLYGPGLMLPFWVGGAV